MPSKNPRLSVVLSPSLAATLAALAEASGESASSVVRGLLEAAHPALARALDLVRAAKAAKGSISDGVKHTLERVVEDLEEAAAVADWRARRAVDDLVDQAQAIKGRKRAAGGKRSAPAAASAASTPGPVTRGSGAPRKGGPRGRRGGQ